ncbi:metal-dependent phosphohydrolase, partial [Vibrio sp. 10N.222.49.E5]
SLVNQMIGLVIVLLITLTTMLTMVAVKDIFWLENNPERLLDGTGKVSVIKEFIYLALVLGGYAITIMTLWNKLIKRILLSQECALNKVTQGEPGIRLPIFGYNELGSMASMTNIMLDSLETAQNEV